MRTVEEQNRSTANELLNTAMTYARKVLRGYGEIGPFAFTMNADGNVCRETIERQQLPADAASILKILHDQVAARARRGEIQAAAAAANVNLAQASQEGYSEAVVFQIERQGGYAVKVTVPYRIYGGQLWNAIPRRVALGNVIMQEIPATIFVAGAQPAVSQ